MRAKHIPVTVGVRRLPALLLLLLTRHRIRGKMGDEAITASNIEQYRGSLAIRADDLVFELWQVFDRGVYESLPSDRRSLVPVSRIVSPKNELQDPKFLAGLKADPRQTAFEWMRKAGRGKVRARPPLRVIAEQDGTFTVEDGNATVQVLMLVGWKEVPVELVGPEGGSMARCD